MEGVGSLLGRSWAPHTPQIHGLEVLGCPLGRFITRTELSSLQPHPLPWGPLSPASLGLGARPSAEENSLQVPERPGRGFGVRQRLPHTYTS